MKEAKSIHPSIIAFSGSDIIKLIQMGTFSSSNGFIEQLRSSEDGDDDERWKLNIIYEVADDVSHICLRTVPSDNRTWKMSVLIGYKRREIQITNIETEEMKVWKVSEILAELNNDRSDDWEDYGLSDWQKGWEEWQGEYATYAEKESEELQVWLVDIEVQEDRLQEIYSMSVLYEPSKLHTIYDPNETEKQ